MDQENKEETIVEIIEVVKDENGDIVSGTLKETTVKTVDISQKLKRITDLSEEIIRDQLEIDQIKADLSIE